MRRTLLSLNTMQVVRHADRRSAERPITPVCEKNHDSEYMNVLVRTTEAVYFRCGRCGEVVIIRKISASSAAAANTVAGRTES